jgi:hypothetical protein
MIRVGRLLCLSVSINALLLFLWFSVSEGVTILQQEFSHWHALSQSQY